MLFARRGLIRALGASIIGLHVIAVRTLNMDIYSIDQALPAITQALRLLEVQTNRPEDARSEAIRKVWNAVDGTRMFLAAVRRREASENQPNPELVSLWSEASLAIAVIDNDLAGRLRRKAEYWSDPENWSVEQIENARIEIDNVANEANRLLESRPAQVAQRPQVSSDGSDIFISHASEDKPTIAAPLARSLADHGYKVWYDRFTLKLGDSLRREIDKGLASSRFGAVILSHSFFSKEWPQRELDGLFALETSDRRMRILPIWHNIEINEVARFSPTLADRLGVSTSRGLDYVVNQIVEVLDS
jgi:hypothetical protein